MMKLASAAVSLMMAASPCVADVAPASPGSAPQEQTAPASPDSPTPDATPKRNVYDTMKDTLVDGVHYDITDNSCQISATVDYQKYFQNMPAFREVWLNRDFTLDWYSHRSHQVLDTIILRHMASIMTYSTYHGDKQPKTSCRYVISIAYDDKYGQPHTFQALTWGFNDSLASKINWDRFDENKFNEIAAEWDWTKATDEWNEDEQPLSDDGVYHPLHNEDRIASKDGSCSVFLFNSNALFIRATALCRKDYMDTKAGNIALEGARVCARINTKQAIESAARHTLSKFDALSRQTTRRNACIAIEELQQQILNGKR